MLAAALSLALVAAVVGATSLNREPGPEAVAAEPASSIITPAPEATRRPAGKTAILAVAPRPRPEPAALPEAQTKKPEVRRPEKAAPQPAPVPPPKPPTEEKKAVQAKKPPPPKEESGRQVRQKPEQKPKPVARTAENFPEPNPSSRERKKTRPGSDRVVTKPVEEPRAKTGSDEPAAKKSGRKKATRGDAMTLSIEPLGLRGRPVKSTNSQQALDDGLLHLPQTSRPWERGGTKNVYVVGHRLGWPGTGSWKVFHGLDRLRRGDDLVLTGRGETYRYRVSEKLVVSPKDVWVTQPVKGRDLLTLQTCTGPDFSKRLIVRADRV